MVSMEYTFLTSLSPFMSTWDILENSNKSGSFLFQFYLIKVNKTEP